MSSHHTRHRPHSAASGTETAIEDAPRRSWAVLVLALAAQVLVVLDISVVNTALPRIGQALEPRERRPAVDGHRLSADVRRRPPSWRPDRRPAAPPQDLHDRHAGLHLGVAVQRLRLQRRRAHRGPWHARGGRGPHDAGGPLDHHDDLRGRAASQGSGALGRHRWPRHRRGRPGRRDADHLGRMAGHLLGQRPDRCRGTRRCDEDPPAASPSSGAGCPSSTSRAPSPPLPAWAL